MKKIDSNIKKGKLKLKTENLDDLWYLTQIIDKGDLVSGQTTRKIKIGKGEERKPKVVKKKVFVSIRVEEVDFNATSTAIRIRGKIEEGPEDIPKGSYHTLNVDENTTLSILKENWLGFQLEKIKEATSAKSPKILICVFDRETAIFALMKRTGYTVISSMDGEVEKKAIKQKTNNFYSVINKALEKYNKRYSPAYIILASPAFWKEELMDYLKDEGIKSKIVQATCSSATENAIHEVLKRDEVKTALKQERFSEELKLVDELLGEISKKGAAVYAFPETEEAVNAGAVKKLLVTDSFISKSRSEGMFNRLEQLMKKTEALNSKITIVSKDHEGGRKLDGLGGIAAILRYKLDY